MFMILGALAFVALIGSAALGVAMLLAAFTFLITRTWRFAGAIMLCGGAVGAGAGWFSLVVMDWLLEASAADWPLFVAAGFGWAAMLSAVMYALIALLRQPNRWVERRRKSPA
jgi:hypothetical protein